MSEESKNLNLAEFTEGFRERLATKSALGTRIKFIFDEGGMILIDGKASPQSVSNEDGAADATLKMSLDTLNKLYRKETSGMGAFMSGKIKLEGDMFAAMKLDQLMS